MTRVFVSGIGVLAPGLSGWPATAAVLRGEQPYEKTDLALPAPEILSGRERRRSGATVRLALNVAQEALQQSRLPPDQVATVFGSSNGSGLEIHQILSAICEPGMLVSPTLFHNSVHNAAVGYWCIATGNHQASTSIACHDFTFPAALLKGAVQASQEQRPVLVAVFDCPLPEPLHSKRLIQDPMAVAFVLSPATGPQSVAQLQVGWSASDSPDQESEPLLSDLSALQNGTPAGRALPLLSCLARGRTAVVSLRYPDNGRLTVGVDPC